MGVDYSAELLLIVPVTLADFVEVAEESRIVCDHHVPVTARFCPTCGTARDARIVKVVGERLRPNVHKGFVTGEDEDEDPEEKGSGNRPGWFQRMAEQGYVKLNGIELYDLNENSRNPQWVLLSRVGSSGSNRTGGGSSVVAASDLATLVAKFKKGVAKVGLGEREVSVCCHLNVY